MRRKIDWLNHGLEFLVVVVGILLAFQLEKCHSTSQQQELVGEHLNAIEGETEFNFEMIKNARDHSVSNLSRLDTLLNLFMLKEI